MFQVNLDIPVFYGTFADLTKIDLSFFNAKIVRQKGRLFRNYLRAILSQGDFDGDYSYIIKNHENEHLYEGDKTWCYAIIPINYEKSFKMAHCSHFYQLMLSIFPSDFSLIKTINFEYVEGQYVFKSTYTTRFIETGMDHYGNFMFIAPAEYRFVKNYLKEYFYNSLNIGYIKYILSLYSNAMHDENTIYQYLSLIICLEVTVDGQEQLSYKLKRNTALLCGKDVNSCKAIYHNVDQLYKLRSAIVHGNIKPSYKNFKEYNEYLKMLVAKLIRELVAHNISTISDLNDKITPLGYGQNKSLSSNYKSSKYPILDNIRLRYRKIEKYK